MKLFFFVIFISSYTITLSQKVTNGSLCLLFHQVETEEDLEQLLSLQEKVNNNISNAYFGSAIAMKAQYAFSPIKKLDYFKDGTKLIEASIDNSKEIENIYLRLIIQLNTPHFLGYYKNINEDITFISNNVDSSPLTKKWKVTFLENLMLFETEDYDFSSIKDKLVNYKK